MRQYGWILAVGAAAAGISAYRPEPKARGETRLGVNLASVAFFSPEIVFKDVLKQGGEWISQKDGVPWGKGGPLALTPEGGIAKLDEGQYAVVVLFPDMEGKYPGGEYLCLYEGKGSLDFAVAARAIDQSPGKIRVQVDPEKGPISVIVRKVDAKDPIRNIRLIPAAYGRADLENPFDDLYLKRLAGFRVLRFMDWEKTNDSETVEWADRPLPAGFQGGPRGVALEYQIDLANRLKLEPWFCIPHRASDDYVRKFARFVKEKLDPALKFHIEYSNETWNGQFKQAQYCREQGEKRKLGSGAYESQLRYSSQRSVEIFALFEAEWGGRDRMRRVIAVQAGNPWTGRTELDWKGAGSKADELAIAPYFGNRLGDPKGVAQVLAGGLDGVFAECGADLVTNRARLREFVALAADRRLELVAYEGGQHLVGFGGAENDAGLMKLFHAANRDPRMEELYRADLRNWKEAGGGLFCVFSTLSRYSKWGSWGLLEYRDQEEMAVPKFRAIRGFMDELKK